MKKTAVICEYNPFHLGHAYQLKSIEESAVIAVMSGSFTQRGDAAVLSKYDRAEIAVRCGADLVLELPFPYSSASAAVFGEAGVHMINALGCVDSLCFGSESDDIDALQKTAKRLLSDEYQHALSLHLEKDRAYAYRTSAAAVYETLYGEPFSAYGSNDILALSYLCALQKKNTDITPFAIRRRGESYNGEGIGFASATTVRAHIQARNTEALTHTVPKETADALFRALDAGRIADTERLFPLFVFLLRTRGEDILKGLYDIPKELAARLVQAAKTAKNTEELLDLTATRAFSHSRIRRAMLTALMNVKPSDVTTPAYTVVLAANEKGRAILKEIRKTASIPIITKPADADKYGESASRAFSLSARADSIWELLCDTPRDGAAMMREKPRML